MDQDYTDYIPATFNSEKEFLNEIEDISNSLTDVVKDWKSRDNAIKRIGGIILGNFGQDPNFIKFLNSKITNNIIIQMNDLRSTIMKEACRLVCFIAETYKNIYEPGALLIFTTSGVFKLISSANKVITDSGSQCANVIIRNVESAKLIPKLVEQMKSKNATTRLRASQNFLHIVTDYDKTQILDKNIQIIEEFLIISSKDAAPEVRNCSKRLFVRYNELYPKRTATILNQLDHGIQKAVIEEMKKNKENSLSLNSKSNSDKTNKSIPFLSSSIKEKGPNDDKVGVNLFKMSGNVISGPKLDQIYEKQTINNIKQETNKTHDTPEMKKNFPKFFSPQNPSTKEGITFKKKLSSNNNDSQTTVGSFDLKLNKSSPKKVEYNDIEELLKSLLSDLNDKNVCSTFEKIVSIFNEIYCNIESVSNSTLRLLVSSILNYISSPKKLISNQILTVLQNFVEQLPEVFSIDDIEKITKLLISKIAYDESDISKKATSVFLQMKKKFNSSLLIQPTIELISNDTPDDILAVCLEILNILLEGSVDVISKDYLISQLFERLYKISSEKNKNKEITSIIFNLFDNIFNKSQNNFLVSFLSINDNNVKKGLLSLFELHKKNIANFILNNQNTSKDNINRLKEKAYNNEESKINKKILKNQIKFFPENYENDLIKPVNKEFLSRVNTFDSNSFCNYLNSDSKNIISFLISLFKIREEEVSSALEHIVYILNNKPVSFLDNLDLLINRLIFIYDNFPQYFELINQSFNSIASNIDGRIYLKLINRYINKSNQAIIQIILTSLNTSFSQLDKDTLLELLPSFIECLFTSLNHSKTEIRKITVFCIVDLYFIIGEEFEYYINQLNISQKNLINIYINKRNKK